MKHSEETRKIDRLVVTTKTTSGQRCHALFDTAPRLFAVGENKPPRSDRSISLQINRNDDLLPAPLEAAPINETNFFRDAKAFEALEAVVLPALAKANERERELRIWCAGCSSGQEVYSIAILVLEHFPEVADWKIQIIGSDLSEAAVDYAANARYRRSEINHGLPARFLIKYFDRDGEFWQVKRKVRDLCQFRCLDLSHTLPPMIGFHLVLLRNVLLFLGTKNRSRLFDEILRQMNPQGYLVLGSAEQAEDFTDVFRSEIAGGIYFYRPAAG